MSVTSPPDYGDIIEILKKDKFLPGASVERQMVAHVRNLILQQKLAPHTRIPPLRLLATLWQTNYGSVQGAISKLADEGLIIRRPKHGTFVAPIRRSLKRVCIYFNSAGHIEEGFYSIMSTLLFSELSKRAVAITTFFDHRPIRQLITPAPEVLAMVERGEIDALITGSIYPNHTGWLTKLGIPTASIMFPSAERRVDIDYTEFAQKAMNEAMKTGATRIGLIHAVPRSAEDSPSTQVYRQMEKIVAENNLTLVEGDPELLIEDVSWERQARVLCRSLVAKGPLPPVIVIYPDSLMRGVSHYLLQHQIRVPEEVQLICHRNFELPLNLPFPVTWITVKIASFAQALIRQIERQIAGKPLKPVQISVSVEETSAH